MDTPNFEAALRDVKARDPKFRLAAAHRLSHSDPGRSTDALQGLLELGADKVGPIRHAAMEALSDFPKVEGPLREQSFLFAKDALEDLDYNVRRSAVLAACNFADDETRVRLLSGLIRDERQEMRFEACNAASEFLSSESDLRGVIQTGIQDTHQSVRFAAVRAISDHIVRFPKLLELVSPSLEDADMEVTRMAAVAVAQVGDNSGGAILQQALSDPSWMLDSLMSLANAPYEPARETLAAIATGFFRPLTIKAAASAALVSLKDPRGSDGLRQVLRAFRSDGRAFAVDLVGRFKVTELRPELERLLNSPKTVPKEQIQEALALLA